MKTSSEKSRALKFVLVTGVKSFFADFKYKGSRGIIGPYLALLGASALTVALVTGFGELLGYAWRIVSGSLSDRTGKFWPITIFGYIVQMASVPLLALAGTWQMAAVHIILERFGRAIRNPLRDVMLSHAAKEIGYGWAFGVHEALDQFGALFGPLMAAVILGIRGDYRLAFAMMLIPALVMLSLGCRTLDLSPSRGDGEYTPQYRNQGASSCILDLPCGSSACRRWICRFPLYGLSSRSSA